MRVREIQAWDCTFDFLATFYRFVIQLPNIIDTNVSSLLVVNVIKPKPAQNFCRKLSLSISKLLITKKGLNGQEIVFSFSRYEISRNVIPAFLIFRNLVLLDFENSAEPKS